MGTLRITTKLRDDTEGFERGKNNVAVTTTGAHMQWARPTVGTVEESFAIDADILAGNGPGYAHIYNMDETNYAQVGIGAGAYFARIKKGEPAVFPIDPSVTSLFLKANTASVMLEILIFER